MNLNISSTADNQPITEFCSYRLAMLYYRQMGDLRFCQRLEKSALSVIANQFTWNDLQGILVIADVYESIFYSKYVILHYRFFSSLYPLHSFIADQTAQRGTGEGDRVWVQGSSDCREVSFC